MNDVARQLLSARLRMSLYLLLGVMFAGISAWQAAEGNWLTFSVTLLPVLMSIVAVPNTPVTQSALEGPKGDQGEPGEPGLDGVSADDVSALVQAAVLSELSKIYDTPRE